MKVPQERPWFKVWPRKIPKTLEYPNVPLYRFLKDSAEKHPDKIAIDHERDQISYEELDALSDKLAGALADLNVQKGNSVSIFLPNIPEFTISYYAILKAGGVVAPVNPLSKEIELNHTLSNSDARTMIAHESLYPIVRNVQRGAALENVIIVGQRRRQNTYRFRDLITKHAPQPFQTKIRPKQDVAVIQCTGGTTGTPKGVMLTHYNLISNAIMNAHWFGWSSEDVVLAVLPLYHSWGASYMNSTVYIGATLVPTTRFDPESVLQLVEEKKVTVWYGAATMFTLITNHPALTKYNLSSLRCVKAGAAPIPNATKTRWDSLTGVELILGYGLTEASPETHNSPPRRVKIGSIGIPIIDTDAKIVDIETGTKELPLGEAGELIVKGPQIMKGYAKSPKETDKALRNGWLYTGDIARMDAEGYFYIVDRLKDTIKYKGYSVHPAEVENALYTHPSIKECAVIGKPNPIAGEIPKAYIVLKKGATTTKEELIEYCKEKISPYKRIREVEFVTELPKNTAGKILRRTLRNDESHRKARQTYTT
ncbi:MAG: long-chain fatty acid--CoA ligase [Candidatus Bathyarchaeota archaeon]|nr:MAG: long-chain fatty acid--CoA ligase [Candidatus Bathyarchaeota archaeon]